MTYQLLITSNSDSGQYVQIAFKPYLKIPEGEPTKSGPPVWYPQNWYVDAGKTRKIPFSVKTPNALFIGATGTWCVEAKTGVEAAASQTDETCSETPK